MKSFVSRGLVKHTYNWRYNYYYLKDEGIEYLREYLHIPEGVVPETLTKAAAKPARAPNSGYSREGREGDYEGRRGGDFKRGGYRRGGDGGFETHELGFIVGHEYKFSNAESLKGVMAVVSAASSQSNRLLS